VETAALLAAWYSDARDSANVPVDYTLVRYVKKPSGARPGMVIYTDYKTIYVTPERSRVEALEQVK
jgi:predicted ribosome quality control (RQC) complex YloA/Tae2 family protein